MSLVTFELEAPAQALVDARLDTIDRMLVGRVPRADRLAIVREVEAQIFELLPAEEPGPIDRAAVLAVLRRLDPPEAYLPEADAAIESAEPRAARAASTSVPPVQPDQRRTAVWSGMLGILALVGSLLLPLLSYLLAALFHSESVLLVAAVLSTVLVIAAAVVAIILGVRSRRASGWGTAGLATGITGIVLAVLMPGFLLMLAFMAG